MNDIGIQGWFILGTVTFFASVLRGAIGMGFALIVLPFFLIVSPQTIPSSVILLGLILSIAAVIRDRHALDVSGLKFSVSGRFIGNLIAMLFIGFLSGRLFDWVISAMILIAVGISLLPFSFHPNKPRLFFAGIASGVMGTISSLDGPPIALLYQHQKGATIRATLGGYFVIGSVLSLISLWFSGKLTIDNLSVFVVLAPIALVGFYCSKFLIRYLKSTYVRYSILLISASSAVMIIAKSLI